MTVNPITPKEGAWTPGPRRIPSPKIKNYGLLSNLIRVTNAGSVTIAQYLAPAEASKKSFSKNQAGFTPEEGDSVLITVKAGVYTNLISLSHLTEEELDLFLKAITGAIEEARPSVQQRDALAKEAEANGDYSYARSNRPSPRVTGTPWPV